jgi:hypothetical protein
MRLQTYSTETFTLPVTEQSQSNPLNTHRHTHGEKYNKEQNKTWPCGLWLLRI